MKKNMLFVALIFLVSCNENRIYHEFDKNFESNRWYKSDVKIYNFTISEENKYDIIIDFSHVYDYDMASIPLIVKMKVPDKSEITESLELPIKDQYGKQLADCSGDICDLYYTYKSGLNLPVGEYSISIVNKSTRFDFLPNVLGIGLSVNRSK